MSKAGDSVEISPSGRQVSELNETLKNAPAEPNPRIKEIRGRVESGYYDSAEVRQEIAGALLNSSTAFHEVVDEVARVRDLQTELDTIPDTRSGRVDEARQRMGSGFYDQSEIREQTAQSFLDEIV
ncbi:MAG: flagellar biosynthesis anti-sigma factor FlgM [Candidatus Latescibacterota bacterium]|nr:flagellar biosynthesis anti-sigma factor FlgM [Candidatus Latescibacterota bacterium]